jgi:hypothetical protein
VDGLACLLHQPTTCRCQTRGQGFLPGAVLSRRAAVGGGALLGDTPPPSLILAEVLFVSIPALLKHTYGKSFLSREAYPLAESS